MLSRLEIRLLRNVALFRGIYTYIYVWRIDANIPQLFLHSCAKIKGKVYINQHISCDWYWTFFPIKLYFIYAPDNNNGFCVVWSLTFKLQLLYINSDYLQVLVGKAHWREERQSSECLYSAGAKRLQKWRRIISKRQQQRWASPRMRHRPLWLLILTLTLTTPTKKVRVRIARFVEIRRIYRAYVHIPRYR